LVVTRLIRLARSTRDLLNVIEEVSKWGAGFRSLKDAWADTTTAHGRAFVYDHTAGALLASVEVASTNWENYTIDFDMPAVTDPPGELI